MYPRLSIDIGWRDLLQAARYCLHASKNARLPLDGQAASESIVSLSVRSAFDLLLSALDLPAGSEVLLSEVTVPHMPRIIEQHGLVPITVPVDPRTLEVHPDQVRNVLTSKTRVLLVAHLFGARMPLDALGQLCREQNIVLVEDCAQALVSGNPQRDSSANVSLYSFGPIKTATALGGAIALVQNAKLRDRMNDIASSWPQQSTASYLRRVIKMSWLKLLSKPVLLSLLVGAIELVGSDADAFVGTSARGFSDERLFDRLRQQPCPALQRLLGRRLARFAPSAIVDRSRRGERFSRAIQPSAFTAGCDNPTHTYWVLPVVCDEPQPLVRALRTAGFDASQHSGLTVVGSQASDHWFHRTLFVPCGPEIPPSQLGRAARIVREHAVGPS